MLFPICEINESAKLINDIIFYSGSSVLCVNADCVNQEITSFMLTHNKLYKCVCKVYGNANK